MYILQKSKPLSRDLSAIDAQIGVLQDTDEYYFIVISENIVVVCLSNLFTNNLSPAMYIQSCQINAVKNATKNIKNFDDLINKLSEMKTTKKVKVGSETIFLNKVGTP